MEPDQLAPDQSPADSKKPSSATEARAVVAIVLIFAGVEGMFLFMLWPLIHSKVSLDWVVSACVFQGTLISGAISFQRCLRLGPTSEEGKKKREDFEIQLTSLMLVLALAMIMFSAFTSAYDKINPR